MKSLELRFCALFVLLTSCSFGSDFTGKPVVTSPNTRLRIGEVATITVIKTDGVFKGNPALNFVTRAFIYSSNPVSEVGYSAPYAPLSVGGFDPKSSPNLFPVSQSVEITTPLTSSSNVPIPIATSLENNQVKATFTIKGKSAGVAQIRAGFLVNSLEYPNNYTRIPGFPDFDGEITIEVVP